MLHHLAIKVGDVTTATQMVRMVVELHLLVCVALLEFILCSSQQSSCLRSLQAAVIAAEALAIDTLVIAVDIKLALVHLQEAPFNLEVRWRRWP